MNRRMGAAFGLWLLGCAAAQAGPAGAAGSDGQSGFRYANYWERHREGWHFYDDPPERERARPMATTPEVSAAPRELIEYEALQKRLEALRNIAFMNPTGPNVQAYLDLQKTAVDKASAFADVWQRVLWANPYLDYTVQGRPVNATALEVYDQEKERSTAELLASLSKTHVLFFFFRSDCPYCHRFAPLLKAFEQKSGLKILPISVDGGPLPDFPRPERDNGIVATLGVTRVPALFLASPTRGEILPLGAGLLSETELLERIAIATRPTDDPAASSATTTVFTR